jgi:protein kinase-like protein/FHA domain-containing protein
MGSMLQINQSCAGYHIRDLLGQGGQTLVGKGEDPQTGQEVAIRQLIAVPGSPGYETEIERFRRCGRLRIGHPSILDCLHMEEGADGAIQVLPFIAGKNLRDYMAHRGMPMAPEETLWLAVRLADALDCLHGRGIVHRDVKPANILLGDPGQMYLIDLGIGKFLSEPQITRHDQPLGSLEYMAPEQAQNPANVDYRADLYSLGAVLYYTLTLQPPVRGGTPNEIRMSLDTYTPPRPCQVNPSVPSHLDDVCMRLLSKSRDARPGSARELLGLLQGGNQPSSAGFCSACGAALAPQADFCTGCGAPQGQGAASVLCLACGASTDGQAACLGCGRPFSLADHRLAFRNGAMAGAVFRIPEGIYEIGRNELCPRDSHISRRHLRVECSNGQVRFCDAGSANRTYVAGTFVDAPVLLQSGQEIRIAGNTGTYTQA